MAYHTGVALQGERQGLARHPLYESGLPLALRYGICARYQVVEVGEVHEKPVRVRLLGYVVKVKIDPEVALDGPLRHGFGCDRDGVYLLAALGHGVDVGGGPADVEHHQIAQGLPEQDGGLHDRAGGGDYRAVYHVAHGVHARGVDYVVLEDLLYYAARRVDVELVHPGVDVLGDVQPHPALLGHQGDLVLVLDVARVDHRHVQPEGCYSLEVEQGGVALAEVHPARDQDYVRGDLADPGGLGAAQPPGGDVLEDGPGTQGRLARRPHGHIADEPVDRHAKASGRARRGEHLVPLERVGAEEEAQVLDRAPQPDRYIALQHGGGGLPLPEKNRAGAAYAVEGVDHRGGAADLGDQHCYLHFAPSSSLLLFTRKLATSIPLVPRPKPPSIPASRAISCVI
ncbi:MAG: hypothetical protein BWY99_01487 [Synergistetes bacterium ADurb.BinA166]|nr:MAG: hypothetical protein BWY99_01487 [Synergistetes bacterium ADurb.BinA166]